ncbi:beta transducin [Microbotryomycetes sp. JL221]|nr:beta transducin [Microbotryomycetes sp. JL221]
MVRSYLRHGPTESFGLVCSNTSNSVYDGKKAYVPALEDVLIWDVKKAEQHAMWHETGLRALVTSIERSPTDWTTFAVGYQDGSIRLWSTITNTVKLTFNGHQSAISCLAWDADGTRLASGSKDTDVIVWDTVAEQGLFRLKGHRNQVMQITFINNNNTINQNQDDATPSTHLLTASKDTFLKIWDLTTQHCIETIVGHRNEVWSFAYSSQNQIIVSGGGQGEIKCWKVDPTVLKNGPTTTTTTTTMINSDDDVSLKPKLKRSVTPIASLNLPTTSHTHHISQITLHPTLPVLAIHSSERTIDVFRVRTEQELKKKLARRKKRNKEKQERDKSNKVVDQTKNDNNTDDANQEEQEQDEQDEPEWKDRLAVWSIVRTTGKIKSFSFAPETLSNKGQVQIMTALNNNSLEVYNLISQTSSKTLVEPNRMLTLDLPGHRNDVRCLSVSSDDELIATASQGQLKIWNRKTTKCLRTMECGYAICCTFLPGDRHVVVGCKSGQLMLFDLSSSSLIETFEAHSNSIWSIEIKPDQRGLITGSSDKDVKFWDFEVRETKPDNDTSTTTTTAGPTLKVLTMVHVKTLKMTDDVLNVKFSPDGKLLAVALLDSTVKVFFADTLKFSLSLYGHKLPVLSLDISDDSKLIVTCSADKNIKIWGLDFGDCHRSLFGHSESIMKVCFEHSNLGSHFFWSCSKDGTLKYWDGDKFECIQKLLGHSGEIWALDVSKRGNFVVSASHDKSIRIWEKTDEPLFLEEEREREMEELFDTEANARQDRDSLRTTKDGQEQEEEESTDVTKSTTETLMAGEKIMEALDISIQDKQIWFEYQQELTKHSDQSTKVPLPTRHAIFQMYNNCSSDEYVLKVIKSIPAANLQDALLVLPFSKVSQLIQHLDVWASNSWEITTTSRILFFLLRTHHSQIVATKTLRSTMMSLRLNLRLALQRQKTTLGYNLAGLRYLQRQHEASKTAEFLERDGGMTDEETLRNKIQQQQGLKKRKRATLTTS